MHVNRNDAGQCYDDHQDIALRILAVEGEETVNTVDALRALVHATLAAAAATIYAAPGGHHCENCCENAR